jgi:hypothetical protein
MELGCVKWNNWEESGNIVVDYDGFIILDGYFVVK